MKKLFPVCVIDDFYENPHEIRQLALSQKFIPNTDGRWPGARTDEIIDIDTHLYHYFCHKILSIFYDREDILDFDIDTCFQKIKPFHSEKTNRINRGFIHTDQTLFGGVIYFDLDYEERTGTSIYSPKKKWLVNDPLSIDVNHLKIKKYKGGNLSDHELNLWDLDRSKYIESVRVENVFNRCIMFDGNDYHGVPYFGNKERLTQVFFVNNIAFKKKRHPRYPLIPYNS